MKPAGRLRGKVAVITGGAAGIGRATVQKFCEEGAEVAFLDRDGERGKLVESEIRAQSLSAMYLNADVTDGAAVSVSVQRVVESLGRIDVLVNNAGIAAYFDAATMTEEEWETVFAVDLKGVWLCTRAVLPIMRTAGVGSIVNVSSIHARMTTKGMFPYAAAKAGVVGMTRSLALDEGPNGIRVNAICPGYTRTELVQEYFDRQPNPKQSEQAVLALHPLGRIGSPSEIANVIAFLASDEASFISGAEIVADGGLTAMFAT